MGRCQKWVWDSQQREFHIVVLPASSIFWSLLLFEVKKIEIQRFIVEKAVYTQTQHTKSEHLHHSGTGCSYRSTVLCIIFFLVKFIVGWVPFSLSWTNQDAFRQVGVLNYCRDLTGQDKRPSIPANKVH